MPNHCILSDGQTSKKSKSSKVSSELQKKDLLLSIESWLVNDGILILLTSPYNWVVFHPLYNLNNQVFFHCSSGIFPPDSLLPPNEEVCRADTWWVKHVIQPHEKHASFRFNEDVTPPKIRNDREHLGNKTEVLQDSLLQAHLWGFFLSCVLA